MNEMSIPAQDRAALKRARILDAAFALACANGMRGTTMEAIAREAGIAKATLYTQFPDKTAVFDAVLARFVEQTYAVIEAALAQSGSGVERAANALAAKHKLALRAVEGSPHAHELELESRSTHRKVKAPFELWLEQKIASALAEDNVEAPQQSAKLLIACADGIAARATQPTEIGPAIRLVAQRLFG